MRGTVTTPATRRERPNPLVRCWLCAHVHIVATAHTIPVNTLAYLTAHAGAACERSINHLLIGVGLAFTQCSYEMGMFGGNNPHSELSCVVVCCQPSRWHTSLHTPAFTAATLTHTFVRSLPSRQPAWRRSQEHQVAIDVEGTQPPPQCRARLRARASLSCPRQWTRGMACQHRLKSTQGRDTPSTVNGRHPRRRLRRPYKH